ncbi:MAG: M48 family metallopeptidase [Flavobacteriaceae bacterium]|nr:M48 family metallopeptidase [Flavobacteriaceae bacterium]
MKSIRLGILALLAIFMLACVTNPMTGRKSFQTASNSELSAAALTQYRNTLSKSKVITNTADAKRVRSVGLKIKNAAENYYRSIGREGDLANYNWEFNLIENKQVNAWCMPGGKVAFYTGIMPICKDDTGVAVVMGHEVAHALAGHGNERVSQAMVAQLGGAIIGGVMKKGTMASIFQQLYPIGAQGVILSYGRKQELEADEMGLYLMAMAGYDPREAKAFWHRMEAGTGKSRQPEFLSTHPHPENRRADMDKHMPRALEYYKASGGKL